MDENSSSTKRTPFTLYTTHVFSSTIHNTEPKRRQGVNDCLMFLSACNTAKTIPTCVVSQIQSDTKQIKRKKNPSNFKFIIVFCLFAPKYMVYKQLQNTCLQINEKWLNT